MEVRRIFDLLDRHKQKFGTEKTVLAGKEGGEWKKYNIEQYVEYVDALSYALLQLGIGKGDRIATICDNRPEWNFLDMAIMQLGAVHLPIYPTISESDYTYIINHAGVKLVFVAGIEVLRKIQHILNDVPSLMDVYTFKDIDDVKHLNELIELGKKHQDYQKLLLHKAAVHENDMATLIYTSGTTGKPKGVMLSHKNLITNFKGASTIPPFGDDGVALSYLPLSHVYERMMIYMYHYIGASVYYAENMARISDNMLEVRPLIMTTVPRLLEKIFDKIQAKGRKLKGVKRWIFFWALSVGFHYEYDGANSIWYKFKLKLADKLVFKHWRAAFGGRMEVVVSGGAALQERLCRIFNAAGIPVLEGYGLSETSPVLTVNHFGDKGRKFGTVGLPLKGVSVKIAHDGEILAKGESVMLGYYQSEEQTREVIDDEGWFHTGDIGMLEPEGHLRITGRKKAIFKTSMGKYISPEHIENKLVESPFIDAALVVGENEKFAGALIVPDFNHLQSWCRVKGIQYASQHEMVQLDRVQKRIRREVNHFNRSLGSTEQVKKIGVIDHEWSVKTGEFTASLKLRRDHVSAKYVQEIRSLFA